MLRSQMRLGLVKESRKIAILVLELLTSNNSIHFLYNASRFIVSFLINIGLKFCFEKITATSLLICKLAPLG